VKTNSFDTAFLAENGNWKLEENLAAQAQETSGIEYCSEKAFNIMKIFRLIETGSKPGKRHGN
jgi:hypothetical protein